MVESTKNEKAINSATFPKISVMKQYDKKNQNDFTEMLNLKDFNGKDLKFIKSALIKKDLVVLGNEVLLCVGSCIKDNELDKAKLIQLVRNACKFNSKISIYGWNNLMIGLNIQYGNKRCLDLIREIKNFIIKHGQTYLEATLNESKFEIVKASESILRLANDNLIVRHPEEETSSYFGMWAMYEGTYFIHDEFYQALLNYGYSKDQIRAVIHGCTMSGKNDLIPFYLRKKYLTNPDSTVNVKRILLEE